MKGVEEIYYAGKLLAIVFRNYISIDGVKFLTHKKNPFQIGIHSRAKGVKLAPHFHKIGKPVKISHIQEMLYVQSGKIRVSFYSKKGEIIQRKILKKEDSTLFLDVGHGVDMLEDSRIFQVKQGPYSGTVHAKIYLEEKK